MGEETLSTLKFAQRARMIKNLTRVNATESESGFKATKTTKAELEVEIEGLTGLESSLKLVIEARSKPTFDPDSPTAIAAYDAVLAQVQNGIGNPEVKESLMRDSPRGATSEGKRRKGGRRKGGRKK